MKVDDVQFVGYPVSLKHSPTRKKGKDPKPSGSTFCIINVVFALPVSSYYVIASCFFFHLSTITARYKQRLKLDSN